jgi:hypothetical protein
MKIFFVVLITSAAAFVFNLSFRNRVDQCENSVDGSILKSSTVIENCVSSDENGVRNLASLKGEPIGHGRQALKQGSTGLSFEGGVKTFASFEGGHSRLVLEEVGSGLFEEGGVKNLVSLVGSHGFTEVPGHGRVLGEGVRDFNEGTGHGFVLAEGVHNFSENPGAGRLILKVMGSGLLFDEEGVRNLVSLEGSHGFGDVPGHGFVLAEGVSNFTENPGHGHLALNQEAPGFCLMEV